jgi:hypothetical protein
MSFILRTVLKNGTQLNLSLGKEYLLFDRETNYDKFYELYEKHFGVPHRSDSDPMADNYSKGCYALLVVNEGKEVVPLYKKQSNYIMTESGKTFANLTYK